MPRKLRAAALWTAIAGAAVVCGAAVASGRPMLQALAFTPLLLVVAVVVSRVEWLPFLLALAATATVAEVYALPSMSLGPLDVFLPEMILGLAVGARLVQRLSDRDRRRFPTAMKVALGVFIAAIAGGFVVGIRNGATMQDAIISVRPMVFYAGLWLAIPALRTERARRRVFACAAGMALLVVGLQVVQFFLGSGTQVFVISTSSKTLAVQPGTEGFFRVRPPGLRLVYVVAIFSAAYLFWGPRRRRGLATLVCIGCLVGPALALERNMLIGIVLGLASAALLVRRKGGGVVAAVLGATLLLGVVMLAEGTYGSAARDNVIVDRILTIGNVGSLVKSDSLYDRFYENELAIRALKENPVTGLGWGVPYGAKVAEPQPDGTFEIKDRLFIHNQYLSLWMRTGLLGVIAFVVALGAALVYGAAWARRRVWDDQTWLGAAIVAAVVALSMSSLVEIYLLNPNSIVVVSLVLALAMVLRRELEMPAAEAVAARPRARELRSTLVPQ